jgi:hypothetical protein
MTETTNEPNLSSSSSPQPHPSQAQPQLKSDPLIELSRSNPILTDTDCENAIKYYCEEAAVLVKQDELFTERLIKMEQLRQNWCNYRNMKPENNNIGKSISYDPINIEIGMKFYELQQKRNPSSDCGCAIFMVILIVLLCFIWAFLGFTLASNNHSNELTKVLQQFDDNKISVSDMIIKGLQSNLTNCEKKQESMMEIKPKWKVMDMTINKDDDIDVLIIVVHPALVVIILAICVCTAAIVKDFNGKCEKSESKVKPQQQQQQQISVPIIPSYLIPPHPKKEISFDDVALTIKLCNLKLQDTSILSKMISECPTVVHETNKYGETLLMNACTVQKFDPTIFKLLIDLKSDINARDKYGVTVLMHACRYHSNISLVKMLIDTKVDIKARDNDGKTALMRIHNIDECVEMLKLVSDAYKQH